MGPINSGPGKDGWFRGLLNIFWQGTRMVFASPIKDAAMGRYQFLLDPASGDDSFQITSRDANVSNGAMCEIGRRNGVTQLNMSGTISANSAVYMMLNSIGEIGLGINGQYGVRLRGTWANGGQGNVLFLCGTSSTNGAAIASIPYTPAQLTADVHNYNPGSAGAARYFRLSSDASRNVTGLAFSQSDGLECEIWNVGSFNIVLKHQDANSTAANRFICTGAADITLAADEIALLRYDSTTTRWRVRKV